MRPRFAVLFALLIAGCTKPDPTNSILPAGSTAIVSRSDGGHLDMEGSGVPIKLEPGIRLTVGYDPGFYEEDRVAWQYEAKDKGVTLSADELKVGPPRHLPGDPQASMRSIKVVVESGLHAGKAGHVSRYSISPLP